MSWVPNETVSFFIRVVSFDVSVEEPTLGVCLEDLLVRFLRNFEVPVDSAGFEFNLENTGLADVPHRADTGGFDLLPANGGHPCSVASVARLGA